MIQLDLRSSTPIYEQIISQYKYMMLQGYLKEGDAIPSVRKLAMELEVTPGTVAKAYRELEQQGLIHTIRGRGTYISEILKEPSKPEEGVIEAMKEKMRQQCMELIYQGLDREEILKLMQEILDDLQGGE